MSSPPRPLNVLLLCDFDPFNAQMVQDHVHALARLSAHRVRVLSFRRRMPEMLDLSRFDAIVIHYSLFVYDENYIDARTRERIAAFSGMRAVFLQDEYKHVERTRGALAALKADIVFTCLPEQSIDAVYRVDPALAGVRFVAVLTGYVTRALRDLGASEPPSRRPIDIGYRGRRYPAWHGRLGRERTLIVEHVARAVAGTGLRIDLSVEERDRLYGAQWLAFMRRCKAMLGTESGASVFDFSGEIARQVEAHQQREPQVTYASLRELYFADAEDRIAIAQISPRIFEAIAAGCVLMLLKGDYSGRLVAGRHYIPIEKDFSNLDAALELLNDGAAIDAMAATARREVLGASDNQEEALIAIFDHALAESGRISPGAVTPYAPHEFVQAFGHYASRWHPNALKRLAFGLAFRCYAVAMRPVPNAWEARLRAALKALLARLRR
jgi:hypothetical protein